MRVQNRISLWRCLFLSLFIGFWATDFSSSEKKVPELKVTNTGLNTWHLVHSLSSLSLWSSSSCCKWWRYPLVSTVPVHFISPANMSAQDVPVSFMETLQIIRLRSNPQQSLQEICLHSPFQHLPTAASSQPVLQLFVLQWPRSHLSVFLSLGITFSTLQTSGTSLSRQWMWNTGLPW